MAWVLKSNRPPGKKRSSFFDELKYLAQAILGRDEEMSDVAAPDLAAPSDVLFAEPRRLENVLLRDAFEDVPEPTAPVEPIEYRLPPEFVPPRGTSRQLPVVSRAYQDSPKARFTPVPKEEDRGPGVVSELLNIPTKVVSAFAEPISRIGATDEHERAIREYLESWGETVDLPVDPEDVPNPFMLIPEDFLTPEQWNRLGRALMGFGEAINPLTALPALAKWATPDFLKEFARKQIHGVGHQFLRASPELDKSAGGAIMGGGLGGVLGGPPGAALGALVGGLTDLSGPAATFAEQLYAASGAPEEEFRAWLDHLYPEGAPDTQNIRNQLLAELFDPLTYVGQGPLKNAIANAASSAVRPFGYDDESTPLERALFGFAATPALAGAFKLAGRAAGAAGRDIVLPALMVGEDVASRIVREAETESAIRSLERALDVAERRGAPTEVIEGIKRQIVRAAAGAPARSTRFTRAAGRALSAADQVPAEALAAGGAAVGATVGIGRQFANRLAESGDEQLEQHTSEPSPVRERNNALIASAALVGALIAGRRRVDDLLDDELRSALRYFRDGPEFVVSAAIGGRTLQGRPVTGETHADAWARLAIERGLATPEDDVGVAAERALNAGLGGDEGFVTSRGRFVSRAEARDLLYGRTGPSDEGGALIAEELGEDVSTAEMRRVFRSLEDAARLRGIDPDNPEHLLDTKEWRQRRRESRVGHPYPDGNDEIARAALQFVRARRPDAPELTRVRAIDENFAKRVADWYESARSNPDDPEVRAAYAQFVEELEEQAEMLRQMGYEMEPVMEDPYPNSFAMMRDLLDKKRIKVYAGETEHPILTHDQQVLFRWVHDVLGHGGPGNQFGPVGEENAYREHARMFSPLARRVLATETRGQNSWVNYGPHLRRPDGSIPQKGDPDYIPPIRRPYAEQKAVLMPEELVAPYSDPRALERLGDIFAVAKTISELHRENGGSTWNFFHGNMSGKPYYAVSIYPDRAPDVARSELVDGRDLSPEVIEAFVRRNADLLADERNSLGTWYDPEVDKTYLEVALTTPDRDLAVGLGMKYNQRAIYDLGLGKVIETGGTGDPVTDAPPAIFRLLTMRGPDEPRVPPIETPAFRKWFGDSKVVDEQGQPLVVYHGTAEDITEFVGRPIWFTPDPRVASDYADRSAFRNLEAIEVRRRLGEPVGDDEFDAFEGARFDPDEIEQTIMRSAVSGGEGQTVYPVYLKMERPLDMRELGAAPETEEVFEWLKQKGIIAPDESFDDFASDLSVDRPALWKIIEDLQLWRDIQRAGYDGFIIDDIVGGGSHPAYAVFEPTQIKSVANRGAFDPTDPRIIGAVAGVIGAASAEPADAGDIGGVSLASAILAGRRRLSPFGRVGNEVAERIPAARKKIAEVFGKQDPTIVGAGFITSGARSFDEFARKMRAEYGDRVEGILDELYDASFYRAATLEPPKLSPKGRSSLEVARELASRRTSLENASPEERLRRLAVVGANDAVDAMVRLGDARRWYREDIQTMEELTRYIFPETGQPEKMGVFKAILAIFSNGNNPVRNYEFAAEVYAHYRQHGRMPGRLEKAHPRAGTHVKQLQKLQKLIDAEGEKGAIDFLSAVVKSARKEEYGAVRLLGPKIGRFYLNTQGIRDEAAIDVWAIRTFRRILGHVKTTVGKTGEELLDRPVNAKEAAEARRAFAHIAKNLSKRTGTKFDTADVQALLWYYEKELYRVSGAKDSGQSSFADAAAQYIAGQPLRARDRIGPVGWDDYQPRRRGDVAAAGDLGPARADAEGGGASFAGGSPRGAEGDRVGSRPAASRAGRVLSVAAPVLAAQAFSEENDYNGYGAALASIGLVGANPRAASRALRKFEPDTERYFLWRKTPWSHYGTTYEFETPVGDVAVDVAHHGEELVIRWMGHPSHDMNRRVHLGVEGVRHVLSQVLRDYPRVKTLRATRVSGVREGRGLGKQGLVKDIKRLREAGLLGAAGVLAAQAAGEDEEAAALLATAPFVGRPRFYSRLEAAVERGPEKTTVAKWLKLVQTQAHKQERRWTGIEDWLKSQGNKSLTRDEVLDFVRQNGIGLGERVLLDDPEPPAELLQKAAEWQALSSKRLALRNELERAMQNAGYSEDQVEQYLHNPFGRLVAPAAEQERMLENERRLLTQLIIDHDNLGFGNALEAKADIERSLYGIAIGRALFDVDQVVKSFDWGSEKEAARATRIFNRVVEANRKLDEVLKTDGPPDVQEVLDKYAEARHAENRAWNQYLDIEHEHRRANAARFGNDYTLPGGENYREILIILSPESARGAPFKVPEHWGDIENVVVHVRLDDRTLPNGEKVLFIEEIQSDWQQLGREEGFGSSKFLVRTPDGVREYSEQHARMLVRANPGSYELIGPSVNVGVPDMPFQESADVLGLAWKRILDEAIEGGYDRIAWTTGEQQAKRYDLSRHVDELVFDEKSGRKAGMGTLYGLVDGVAVVSKDVAREDLPRYIGKELANRMLTEGWDPGAGVYRLDSSAMVVDPAASGLSHFYDRMVPEWIQSYAKKNGVVVEPERIDIEAPGDEAPFNVPSIRISGGVGRKLAEEGFPILGTAGILVGALPANEREDVDEIKLAAFGLLAGKKPSNLSDPVRRVLSRVDRGGLPDLEPKRRLERAYTYWIDHLYPIKRATTDVAKRIGERKPEFDAEMLARAAQGDHGYAAEVLKRGIHPPGTLERRTRGLEEIYSELGERQEDLIAYRIARRALELMDPNRPGGPRTTGFEGMEDQLRLVVRQFESDPLIHRIHEELKDYHKQWLKLLEEEGVLRSLTKEEREEGFESLADLIESRGNREYTPFFRTKKQAERVFGPAKGGKRLANLPTPVKRLLGSERPIIDPMESDIRMTFVYSTLVMRQRVANALAEIAENVPDQPWIQRIRAPMQRVSFSKEQLRGQIDDELLDNIEPEHLSVFTRRPLTQRDQIISVNGPDGRRRYYEVEPMLYEALMGMSGHQVTAAVRLLSLPASILRTGVTITPDFAIANFIRDTLQTAITSDAKGPPPRALVRAVNDGLRGLAALMVAGNPGALKRTAKAAAFGGAFGALVPTESEDRPLGAAAGAALAGAFAAGARGIARGGRLFGRRGVTETMKPEDIISLWRSSGGDHAAYLSMDRRSIRDAIRQMRKQGKKFPVAWTPMDAIRAIGETARGLGEVFENATRVGEFMAQLDRAGRVDPLAATSAAVFSRDVSTDFKRHGAGIVVEILRPMAAFWNARVQGLDKIRRQARVNPKRVFPTLFLTVTAPSMALYALNTKLTEEDPERWDYWDRPMWERNMFWLVPLPDGGYLRIPKPFELGLFFGSLPERMVEAFDPRNPHRGGMAEIGEQAWKNFASLLSETFLPLPTAAVPWIENFVNFDLFTGRPIHSPYEAEELDPRLKGREKSSEVAGRLSDLQGAMADVVSRKIPVLTSLAEWLQMTPAEIDNVLRDYTGSLGREVVHGLDRVLRDEETRGKPPAPQRSQRPLTGRFFGDVPYPYGEHVEQFYGAKTAAEGAKATFDRLVEMGRMEQAGAFFERQAGKVASADMGQEVAGQLSQLRELRKLVENDPTLTPEEKRKEIDEINRLMSELARETGQLMRELQRESAKR